MIRTLTFAAALAAAIALPAIAEDVKPPGTGAGTLFSAQTMLLTAQEAKAWVGRPAYISDGKKLCEGAAGGPFLRAE